MKNESKKIIEKKIYAFVCMFLIISMTFTTAYSLSPEEKQKQKINIGDSVIGIINYLIPGAMADTGCCVNKGGSYCVENTDSGACTSENFYSGSSCSARGVSGCEIGTCIETNGDCSTFKPKAQCDASFGYFVADKIENIPECKPGCCKYKSPVSTATGIIGPGGGNISLPGSTSAEVTDNTAFTEWKRFSKQCEVSANNYNLAYEVAEDVDDASTCASMVSPETKGYCWLPTTCFYGKKSDCPEEGVFNQEACPHCQLKNIKKCSKGDLYWANACGELGSLIQACTTGVALCTDSKNVTRTEPAGNMVLTGEVIAAHCADVTCTINITKTTLQYDTGWLNANEVGVIGKNIYEGAPSTTVNYFLPHTGNTPVTTLDTRGPAKMRVGDKIILSPGESVCVQYQGPGESHMIYVCNNDGTTGIIEAGALSPARTTICTYNFAVGAADKKVNNYGSCKDCNSRTLPTIPDWLESGLSLLGMEMINPEWWDYYAIAPGFCDKEDDCKSQGDCVRIGNEHDCVPKYTPGNAGSCTECMDTKASSPWNKCPEKGCAARGYCQWNERRIDPINTITICGIETITGNLMSGAISGLFKATLGEERTDSTKDPKQQEKLTGWRAKLNAWTLGVFGVIRNTLRGLVSQNAREFYSRFFGWDRNTVGTLKGDSDSLSAQTKDVKTKIEFKAESGGIKGATATYNSQKDRLVIAGTDSKGQRVSYSITSDGKVYGGDGLTEVAADKLPPAITAVKSNAKSYFSKNTEYNKAQTAYKSKVNEIFANPANKQALIEAAGIKPDAQPVILNIDSSGSKANVKDRVLIYTTEKDGARSYQYSVIPAIEVTQSPLYSISEAELTQMIQHSNQNAKIASDAVGANSWKYSNYYGGAFYTPMRSDEISGRQNVARAAKDYLESQGGFWKFLLRRFVGTAKATIVTMAMRYALEKAGASFIAQHILGNLNPAFYIKRVLCVGTSTITGGLYAQTACEGDKLGVPIFVCGLQNYAMTGGDMKQNTCTPTTASDLSPYNGYEYCYLCNADVNRPCTQDRCYALSKQGSSGCLWDELTTVCAPNPELCTGGITPIKIDAIDQAVKVRVSTTSSGVIRRTIQTEAWNITGIDYGVEEYQLNITTNKYAECRYSDNKTVSFDNMNIITGDSISLDGRTHSAQLDIKTRDVKKSTFSYFVQCKDICIEASRTNLTEVFISKTTKRDSDGPIFDVSKQSPQPDEILVGDISGKTDVPITVITDEPAKCTYGRYEIAEGVSGFANGMKEWDETAKRMINSGKTEDEVIEALKGVWKTDQSFDSSSSYKETHKVALHQLNNSQTYAYLVNCKDTGNNPSAQNIIKFKVSEYIAVDIVKPAGESEDPMPEIEVRTVNATICKYSLNPTTKFSDMDAMDDGFGLIHTATLNTELTLNRAHNIYVSCLDELGNNMGKANKVFSIKASSDKPELTRAYYDGGMLVVATSKPTVCQFSPDSAFAAFGNGSPMASSGQEYLRSGEVYSISHAASWQSGETGVSYTYYIICKDISRNTARFIVNPLSGY